MHTHARTQESSQAKAPKSARRLKVATRDVGKLTEAKDQLLRMIKQNVRWVP